MSQWQSHGASLITADAQLLHAVPLLLLHFHAFLFLHVIIAKKVKHAMYCEEGQLTLQAVSKFLSLLLSLFHRNDDISQHFEIIFIINNFRLLSISKGKGEDIGRPVNIPVLLIQLVYVFIISEGNAYLAIFHSIKRSGYSSSIFYYFLSPLRELEVFRFNTDYYIHILSLFSHLFIVGIIGLYNAGNHIVADDIHCF